MDFALALARRGGGEHDVGGADAMADFAQDRLGNLLDLRRTVEIGFVDDEQHRLVQIAKLLDRVDLDPVEVAVGDEQHQVGVAHGFLGKLAAQFAGRLVDARRIDQDQLGILKAGLGDFVGGAVLGGDRKDLFARQRIEERALARPDFAERGDLDTAVLELRSEFLDVVHLLLDAGALLRAQPRVRRQLAQRFDRVGQYRLILHGAAGPRLGSSSQNAAFARRRAQWRGSTMLSKAATSLDGRRNSTRTAPRASSISRSTGIGAPAAATT